MSGRDLHHDNTLGVASRAEHAVEVRDERQLTALLDTVDPANLVLLGGGSNVVLRARVPGVVCLMRNRGYREDKAAAGATHVTVAAGEPWHDVVRRTLGRGLCGLENLALIPGSVGAAPIQNIGAYGVEFEQRFVRLRALDPRTRRVHSFDRAACGFGYRDSRFKHGDGAALIVLDVTLRLERHAVPVLSYPDLRQELACLGREQPNAAQVAEAVIRVRRRKLPDPRRIGNVGSFFKNPLVAIADLPGLRDRLPQLMVHPVDGARCKLSAAQLMDACGWKGHRAGPVAVWHRHALVLCNCGGATGRDVLALGEDIRRDVAARFGVHLELEPQVIGEDEPGFVAEPRP